MKSEDGTEWVSDLASRGSRLAAQFIDGIVAIVLLLVVSGLAGGEKWGLALVLFLAYWLLCDGLPNGQSLGKRLLKIAVVDEHTGAPCGLGKSLLRNVTQIVGLFDWVWIFGARRKRAGDFLAGTKVVNVAGGRNYR